MLGNHDPFASTEARTIALRTWTFTPARDAIGQPPSVKIDATFPMDEATAREKLAARGTPVDGWSARMEERPVRTEPIDVPDTGPRRFRVTFRREQTAEVEVEASCLQELEKKARAAMNNLGFRAWDGAYAEIDEISEIKETKR